MAGNYTAPKGILQYNGNRHFFDFATSTRKDNAEEVPDLETFVIDIGHSQTALLRGLEHQKRYLIEYQDSASEWTQFIASNTYLRVAYFDKIGNELWIGGEFSGTLSYASVALESSQSNSAFWAKIAPDGSLVSYQTVKNLDQRMPLVFTKNANEVQIVGRTLNQPMNLGGTLIQTQDGHAANILIGASGTRHAISSFTFDSSLTVAKATLSKDGVLTSYLLKGVGNLTYNQGSISGNGAPVSILATTDTLGNIVWMDTLKGDNYFDSKMDIAYGAGHNLIVSLTIKDTFQTRNTSFVSNGGRDILLLKYDNIGQITGYRQFGSADDEDVLKLFFTDSVLYFGGDFSGPTFNRQIGTYQFFNLNNSASNPYISYVLEGDISMPSINFVEQNTKNKASARKGMPAKEGYSIFPNPFENELVIKIVSQQMQKHTIRLINGLGMIFEETTTTTIGENIVTFGTHRPIAPGIYYVQILSDDGSLWSQKVVKM